MCCSRLYDILRMPRQRVVPLYRQKEMPCAGLRLTIATIVDSDDNCNKRPITHMSVMICNLRCQTSFDRYTGSSSNCKETPIFCHVGTLPCPSMSGISSQSIFVSSTILTLGLNFHIFPPMLRLVVTPPAIWSSFHKACPRQHCLIVSSTTR